MEIKYNQKEMEEYKENLISLKHLTFIQTILFAFFFIPFILSLVFLVFIFKKVLIGTIICVVLLVFISPLVFSLIYSLRLISLFKKKDFKVLRQKVTAVKDRETGNSSFYEIRTEINTDNILFLNLNNNILILPGDEVDVIYSPKGKVRFAIYPIDILDVGETNEDN